MDLLTHIFSGAAAGTVVAALAGGKPVRRLGIVAAGALGGALPDIDAISAWSGFDSTLGRLLGLENTGQHIYAGKFWYSHHAFFHSLAAALLMAVLLGVLSYIFSRNRGALDTWFKSHAAVAGAFVAGYAMHLLGDLPTPASAWGGIRFLWPSHAYVGGTGHIWWWNNYDLFLLAAGCTTVNIILMLTRIHRRVVFSVAGLALLLAFVQVHTRQYRYAYRGNTSRYELMERHSCQEQRRVLGRSLYNGMVWLDEHIPLNF